MAEETKYYTPEISEFHHGFEYEIFEDFDHYLEKSWHKQVYGENGANPENLDFVSHVGVRDGKFRVKFLDKEDIQFFDWKFTGEETNMGQKYTLRDNLLLFHKPYEQMVYICVQPHNEPNKFLFVFQGEIKNKSELHKILKQTSIL